MALLSTANRLGVETIICKHNKSETKITFCAFHSFCLTIDRNSKLIIPKELLKIVWKAIN